MPSHAESWWRSRGRRCVAACLVLLVLLLPPLCLTPATAGTITYLYDALGRLVAVIDDPGATNEMAIYRYDAVGNLLAIERQSANAVSVVGFTPALGPIGTAVVVSGTGFSATPAQNTVTFNGTAATVTAASPTQLSVTVPAGATTGPIAVTAPAGSATSSSPFTVT